MCELIKDIRASGFRASPRNVPHRQAVLKDLAAVQATFLPNEIEVKVLTA